MAQTLKIPVFVSKLANALRRDMTGSKVEIEKVEHTNRFRLAIVWKGFPRTNLVRRQDRVWKIANEVLSDAELLRISMILTLRPDEL